jgi:hypothetical protein
MPILDWTRVDAGLFHAFHHRWNRANPLSLPDCFEFVSESIESVPQNYRPKFLGKGSGWERFFLVASQNCR